MKLKGINMNFIFLSGFDRRIENYEAWLKSLTPRKSRVIFQKFVPHDDSSHCLGAGFECWKLTVASYNSDIVYMDGTSQPIRLDGVACWHDSQAEWPGKVFPARIAPLHRRWKELRNIGDCALSANPLYEPLYSGKTRSVFFAPFGMAILEFENQGLRHYYRTVANGNLVTVFSDEPPTMNDGAVPLYAEYIRD